MANATRMHDGELEIDEKLVRVLLEAQFLEWAALPLTRFAGEGTDNAIFKLGDAFSVRLPKIGWAAEQTIDDHRWLVRLAPALSLAIPESLAVGEPTPDYPYNWAVHKWIVGEVAWPELLGDGLRAAEALAGFIRALRAVDAEGAVEHPRGVDLAERDQQTRAAIAASHERGLLDGAAATKVWERSLVAAAHSGALVPVHADLHPLNLLVRDGRLSAVLDFGCFGVGDPACDVMSAWMALPADARPRFRQALGGVEDDVWDRARGWAFSVAVIALPYYTDTNPPLARVASDTLARTLADREVRR